VFAVDVPNAFTPNGDGSNDRFSFTSSGDVGEVLRFQVFNRWGQVVYDNESAEGWDGQKDGSPQPSDVYAYIIVIRALDGEEVTFQGDVTLIR
jgi:gliding motility-associated-like protein